MEGKSRRILATAEAAFILPHCKEDGVLQQDDMNSSVNYLSPPIP